MSDEVELLPTRRLGNTDVEVSAIVHGTWWLSGAYGTITPQRGVETLEAAYARGVRAFDMAPLWGESEKVVGDTFADRRDELVFITRAGVTLDADQQLQQRYDSDALERDLERSLERLGKVDVWLFHDPTPEAFEQKEQLFELAQAKKEAGLIRAWGVSTARMEIAALALEGEPDVLVMPMNILHRRLYEDVAGGLEIAETVSVLARSPLQHGLLSGRWTEYRNFSGLDHRAGRWGASALATRVRAVNQLRNLTGEEFPNIPALALRWILSQRFVAGAILGARAANQVKNLETLIDGEVSSATELRVVELLGDEG